jgi:hypothetical protein
MESRFILFRRSPARPAAVDIKAARAVLRGLGITIVSTGAAGLLLQTSTAAVRKATRALPGWSYTAETHTHQKPERRRLKERMATTGRTVGPS